MTRSSTRAHDARKHGQEIVSCTRGSVQRKGKESLVRSGIVGKLKIPVFAIMCRVVVEPCSLLSSGKQLHRLFMRVEWVIHNVVLTLKADLRSTT